MSARRQYAAGKCGAVFVPFQSAAFCMGNIAMRRVILFASIGLCGCAADDEMRVLSYTPAGIEYSAWTGAYSRQAIGDLAQQYCQQAGKKAQIIDSETAEKNLFKGSRVVYRFNCVG